MAKKEQIVRTSFSDIQWEDVVFLMKELRADTAHELMRALVRDAARDVRADQLRYGKSTAVPRETQIERRNKLEAMSDAELNAELESLHAFDEYKSGPGMSVFVDTDTLGRRILRQRSANEDNETPLAMFLNQLKNKKII